LKAWASPVEVALNRLEDKGGELRAKSREKNRPKRRKARQRTCVPPSQSPSHAAIYDRSILEQSAVRKIASGIGD